MNMVIDINCDMGESYGHYSIGQDEKLMPLISSCNVACGFHAGDPLVIENTIQLAIDFGVSIGAHPSYPDLQGFGRRKMEVQASELKAIVKYQIAAVMGIAKSRGSQIKYVKPHGALYNSAAYNRIEAIAIIEAIQELDQHLILMGLAGSRIQHISAELGISFVPEAFMDRQYNSDGKLLSRKISGSVLRDPKEAVNQVLSICRKGLVRSDTGTDVIVQARTFCIHGDNPAALDILSRLHQVLPEYGISIQSFV